MGAPLALLTSTSQRSKYFLVCCALARTWPGRGPSISTMRTRRSCSEAPGKRGAQEELGRHAAQRPHVDGHRVGVAQQHLRWGVLSEARFHGIFRRRAAQGRCVDGHGIQVAQHLT